MRPAVLRIVLVVIVMPSSHCLLVFIASSASNVRPCSHAAAWPVYRTTTSCMTISALYMTWFKPNVNA